MKNYLKKGTNLYLVKKGYKLCSADTFKAESKPLFNAIAKCTQNQLDYIITDNFKGSSDLVYLFMFLPNNRLYVESKINDLKAIEDIYETSKEKTINFFLQFGELMGYPKTACEDFVYFFENDDENFNRVFINYNGLQFCFHKKSFVDVKNYLRSLKIKQSDCMGVVMYQVNNGTKVLFNGTQKEFHKLEESYFGIK